MSLLQLHALDNVLVAKAPLAIGQEAAPWGIRIKAQVPAGHKIALRDIAQGERILKYNTEIGVATRPISAGEHVHGHNIELAEFYHQPCFGEDVRPVDILPPEQQARFMGYVRPDGRVGTRNFIGPGQMAGDS